MRKKYINEAQLSLFESNEPAPESTPTPPTENKKEGTIVDFARERFEKNPNMNQEEYKRWIRFLVNNSLKSID